MTMAFKINPKSMQITGQDGEKYISVNWYDLDGFVSDNYDYEVGKEEIPAWVFDVLTTDKESFDGRPYTEEDRLRDEEEFRYYRELEEEENRLRAERPVLLAKAKVAAAAKVRFCMGCRGECGDCLVA
jgi:hypothetical protein